MRSVLLVLALSVGIIGWSASSASAAPIPGPAQIVNDASPIIQVDRRCGRGRHYVPRHRVRGRDGRLHWIAGYCARNR
jgi:hypothetical protein